MSEIDEVLSYWFGDAAGADPQKKWFDGGPDVDAEISSKFAALVEQARAGQLDAWGSTPRGALAWLILVDQFSRNLYRNRPEAFACDPEALAWARAHLAMFASLPAIQQLFALLPFEHAEDLEAQKQGIVLMTKLALGDEAFDQLAQGIEFARKHLDVIARFGRFPHRNAMLGRISTADEADYLAFSKKANQWL